MLHSAKINLLSTEISFIFISYTCTMKRPTLLFLILSLYPFLVTGQNVTETKPHEFSKAFGETFEKLAQSRDSGYSVAIGIFENGLKNTVSNYEKYRMILNIGFLYTATKQYDKAIDMWNAENREGICLPFVLENMTFPGYLSEYLTNKRFQDFIENNKVLRNKANENSKAEYFVNLPENYNPDRKYPLIIVMHGGFGDNNSTYVNWDSKSIKNEFISVFPQGKEVIGTFTRKFGKTGIEDIKEIYRRVLSEYPVDTSKIILAGQSAGGELAIRLTYNDIPAAGLLLAFPVKPKEFDYTKAVDFKNRNIRIIMMCGEKDEIFYAGQRDMSAILDSAGVENRFISNPDLGHDFPSDFREQIDNRLVFLTDN